MNSKNPNTRKIDLQEVHDSLLEAFDFLYDEINTSYLEMYMEYCRQEIDKEHSKGKLDE